MAGEPMLRQGSTGPFVVRLQSALASVGFDPGPIDGIFGPRTDAAVRAFQAARGLMVDGIVGPQTWGALPTSRVRLHIKIVTPPTITIDIMVASMRQVYGAGGIGVEIASTENLTVPASLVDVDTGTCTAGNPSAEQNQLFTNRNGVGVNEVVAYFVRSVTSGSGVLNGCASHPAGSPGAVVSQAATQWTLGHEIGHVLGLAHCDGPPPNCPCLALVRLMTGCGTGALVGVPNLDGGEVATMQASGLTIDF